MNRLRWGIVGGGMLGMTLALRLLQSGQRVTVFESAAGCGGLAAPWQLGDVVWDRHYHVTLYSDTALRALLEEIGLTERMHWVSARTGFYVDDRLYSFSDVGDFLRFPPLNALQKARLAATIVHASRIKDWRPLERVTAIDWLQRCSGRETVEKIWLPLLRAKLGVNAEKASAAFIWAIIARMYAARRSGMKRELFGYMEGGYATTLQRLELHLRSLGARMFCGQRVAGVEPVEDGRLRIVREDGTAERFDRVAVTVPSPLAARLCRGLSREETVLLNDVEYQGIICASALLDRPLAGYYVTNITDRWVPFTAVIEMSALVDRAAFGGRSLVYLPKYVPSHDAAFRLSDAEIEQSFVEALIRMYPGFSRQSVGAFNISRVPYVLPITTLQYSERLSPVRTSIAGLYTVNSSHIVNGTLNVNETVDLANRTAADLLQDCVASPALRVAL